MPHSFTPSNLPRILIAEGDARAALHLQTLLGDMGFTVCGMASTGPRAVALADYHRPELALVDVDLAKGTDGLAAAREMRQKLKLKVLLLTGQMGDQMGMISTEEEDDLPLMQKPIDPDLLRLHLDQMLPESVSGRA